MPRTNLCNNQKSNTTSECIYKLPSSQLPPDWAETFDFAFDNLFYVVPPPKNSSESESHAYYVRLKLGSDRVDFNWCFISHWIYKVKWNPKHKVPGDINFTSLFEADGQFYASILNLCAQITLLNSSMHNPQILFGNIIQEFRNAELKRISEIAHENIWTRRKLADIQRKNHRLLIDGINPYETNDFPYLSHVIEKSLQIVGSNKFPTFTEDYWVGKYHKKTAKEPEKVKGFLEAYTDKISNDLREECQMGRFDSQNQLVVRKGRGNHLTPAPKIEKSSLEIL